MNLCQKRPVSLAPFGLLIVVILPLITAASEDRIKEYPILGEPRTLYVASGDWRHGYFGSLAFNQRSELLIGTLARKPGSATRFLMGQRVGEVRSFEITSKNKSSKLVATADNTAFEVLKSPSGVCREPLLLVQSADRLKEFDVYEIGEEKSEKSLVRKFAIPRAEQITIHKSASICFCLTPGPEILVLGTGCMEWKNGARSATWWGDVKAWDLQTGESQFSDAWDGDQVLAVACSADRKLVAAAGGHAETTVFGGERYEGRVVCWEQNFTKKRFDLRLPKHQVHCLAFSPDSKTLVTGGIDGVMKWIDVAHGTVKKSLDIASLSGKTLGRIEDVAFDPSGNLIAAGIGSYNRGNSWGEAFLIDVPSAKVYKVPSSQEDRVITCVAFSPDGKYLATGSMLGVLKLWEFAARK